MSSLPSLPDAVRRIRPDVVVQGLSKAPAVGLEIISQIHASTPHARIVVVAMWEDAPLAADAFRRGACGYIPQASPPDDLLAGVYAATVDASYVPASLAGALAALVTSTLDSADEAMLSERQRDVVRFLAQGKTMKQVASALQITARTVAFHKYRIMETLDIQSSAELVRFAMKHGLA